MIEKVKEVLTSKEKREVSLNIEEIQDERMKKLETIFDGGEF